MSRPALPQERFRPTNKLLALLGVHYQINEYEVVLAHTVSPARRLPRWPLLGGWGAWGQAGATGQCGQTAFRPLIRTQPTLGKFRAGTAKSHQVVDCPMYRVENENDPNYRQGHTERQTRKLQRAAAI